MVGSHEPEASDFSTPLHHFLGIWGFAPLKPDARLAKIYVGLHEVVRNQGKGDIDVKKDSIR